MDETTYLIEFNSTTLQVVRIFLYNALKYFAKYKASFLGFYVGKAARWMLSNQGAQ